MTCHKPGPARRHPPIYRVISVRDEQNVRRRDTGVAQNRYYNRCSQFLLSVVCAQNSPASHFEFNRDITPIDFAVICCCRLSEVTSRAPDRPHSKFKHVYPIVRIDTPFDPMYPANTLAVVEVLSSKADAEVEVSRLNEVNASTCIAQVI
jgi:hypothetical protein